MLMVFRRLLVCLLWLWLPVSQAADSGWLRAAENQHASVRLRAQNDDSGTTRLLLDVALEKGWKTYWRSPGEGGIAPAIAWKTPLDVTWHWPTPQRFDVAGITTQGYHGNVSFPLEIHGPVPQILSGVLTLSTCSNVCILTDYPFALDMTTAAGDGFGYDFTRALGTLPRPDGLTSRLTSAYGGGKLTVTAVREAGWRQPSLFIDSMENVDFGKHTFSLNGETLVAQIPVTDSWGEAAPDLSGKRLSLVLADSGLAQESTSIVSEGLPAQAPALWSTFSKILAPGMRIGWIVMPDWLAQQTVIVKQAADLHTNMLSQVITAEYLAMNRLDNQIALIREDYRKKCVALADALESRLGEHIAFSRPKGGMFLWAHFRYSFDTMEWMKKTLANGVVFVPGEAFYHDNPDTRTLRLSYSTVSEEGLMMAVERLAKSL